MARAVVILGGNTGDVAANIAAAREMIAARVGRITELSEVMRSEPWGDMDEDAGAFLNQVVVAETALAPELLLDALQEIERELGRVRPEPCGERPKAGVKRKYSSRTMDLDILFYDNIVMETERLTLPHPLIAQREFVLAPLAGALPGYRHPVTGKTAGEMLGELKQTK